MVSLSALLLLLPLVSAFPLERRATKVCGKFDTIQSGPYTLLANLWGESTATSGAQCSILESLDGNSVKWYTKWNWTGGTGVKSFSNIQLDVGINQPLSAITSMPSAWHWSQKNTGTVVSDVAYDLFTSYSASGANVNEIMIWLASSNSMPIAYNYDYSGKAIPVATNLDIAGHTWDLYTGSNGYNIVYSFLPVESSINRFDGDVYEFLTKLIDDGSIQSSEYLVTAQAGTEATSGKALFVTEAYSLTIN
ncbi:glycoside hydrolase family 12 protein [Lanmaoa asiatica]|nr:glycoside hydrolase family 12 protein [Lanmaoa asiatica]